MEINFRFVFGAVLTVFVIVGGMVGFGGLTGYNDDTDYQIHQDVFGTVTQIDKGGWYPTFFPRVATYPRTLQRFWTKDKRPESPTDESMRCTFNDNGWADISTYVKVQLPTNPDQRRLLFRETHGDHENVAKFVNAHLQNCMRVTGPMMSATENVSSRKGEFTQLLHEQLRLGLFQTKVVEKDTFETSSIEEITSAEGTKTNKEKKVKVLVNEIVRDADGKPVILEISPLARYGLDVVQFSVVATDYDSDTEAQFKARKGAILAAEQAKAVKAQQIQERLMVEQRGLRELAEVTAEMNKTKEKATIAAEQAAEVAEIVKREFVTKAMQRTEVAEQNRLEAEKLKQIAAVKAQTAELDKAATISLAQAQQKAIELGGGISEKERTLAQIAADRDVKVSENLAKIQTPNIVLNGGGGTQGSASMQETLMNLVLLKQSGLIGQK